VCCGINFDSFLCEERHPQYGFGVRERGDKEVSSFFRGPILRGDADLAVDLFFNQYTGGMECLADTYRGANREAWEISMTGDPGGDGVDRGAGVNQGGSPGLGNLDRDADGGDGLVRGEFLIRFDYGGLLY